NFAMSSQKDRTRNSTFACVNCQAKRVKCSFIEPPCSRCIDKGLQCVFLKPCKRGPKPKVKTPVPVFTSELISPTCSLLNNLQREEQVLIQKLYIVRQLADVVKTEISASSLTTDTRSICNDPIIRQEQQNSLEYGNFHSTLLPEINILDYHSSQTNLSDSSTNIYLNSSQTNLSDSSTNTYSSALLQESNISNLNLSNSSTNVYPSALQETNTYPSEFLQETSIIDCNASQSISSTNTYPSTLSQKTSIIDHDTSQPKPSNSSTNTCASSTLFKIETPKTMRARYKRKEKRKYQGLALDLEKRSQSLEKSNKLFENELIERYRN
ncbi:9793_t:CDS:1, partial [Gigaspora rosea]